jgi:hypothetical protein
MKTDFSMEKASDSSDISNLWAGSRGVFVEGSVGLLIFVYSEPCTAGASSNLSRRLRFSL